MNGLLVALSLGMMFASIAAVMILVFLYLVVQ